MSTDTPPIDGGELTPRLASASDRSAAARQRAARIASQSLFRLRAAAPRRRLPRVAVAAPAPRLAVAVLALLAGIAGLVAAGHALSWAAGLATGAAAVVWARWERATQPTPPVMEARHETGAVLDALAPAGWRCLRDVPGPDGLVDHIAVGHGGVILLQSLRPGGVVRISRGEPLLERREDPQAPPRLERLRPRALADALTARETVQRLTGRRVWIQSVVVFWSDFPAGCVADGRCVFIHGDRLGGWLSRRPQQLDAAQVDDVFDDVSALQRAYGELLPVAG